MRIIQYTLRNGGKTFELQAIINDKHGRQTITYSRLTGWRKDLAEKHIEPNTANNFLEIIKIYVTMEAIKAAKTPDEALKFIDIVKALTRGDIYFWASSFLDKNLNKKAQKAWRILYAK